MENIISFMVANWYLFAGFLLILALLIQTESSSMQQGIESISPEALVSAMNNNQAIVLDIRDNTAFKQGHILSSLNISADKAPESSKLKAHRARPIVVVCQQGVSAVKAAKALKQAEFQQVSILKGGLSAWQAASYPLSKED